MRTLCTGGCAKTKTHKEEGGVLERVKCGCLHFFVLCTVTLFFLLFLSKLGVDLTTYLEFLELPSLSMKSTFFLFIWKKDNEIFCSELQ